MNWDQLLSVKRLGSKNQHSKDTAWARTQFQKDYDRLIFSSPFRRLQNKTQVFPLPGSVFVHNRLTHSLEVASIGRSLGDMAAHHLSSDPTIKTELIHELGAVVAAACLAHDIGNPPFGHSGETAISHYFNSGEGRHIQHQVSEEAWADLCHFEGNANAFRVLTHQFMGRRKGGFALTYTTLAALVKYPYASTTLKNTKKYGYFSTEAADYQLIAEDLGINKTQDTGVYARHPLVYLVEAADDIAYQLMDLEDAHKLNILSLEETESLFLNFFNEIEDADFLRIKSSVYKEVTDINERIAFLRASVISSLVNECLKLFLDHQEDLLEGSFSGSLIKRIDGTKGQAMKKVKEVSINKIYNYPGVITTELSGYNILGTLLEEFIQAIRNPDLDYSRKMISLIPPQYLTESENLYHQLQTVLDFVSNMTDLYAVKLYKDIKGISLV